MRWLGPVAAAALLGLAGLGWAEAVSPPQAEAALRAARAAAIGGAHLAAALGCGALPTLGRSTEGPRGGWPAALLLGLCLMGALGVLALAIGAPPWAALAVMAIPAVGGLRGLLRGADAHRTAPARAPIAAAALVLLFGSPVALAPSVDTDALYQHLGLAQRMIYEGGLVGGPLHPDASRPLLLIGLWASPLSLGGPAAAGALHLGVAAVTAAQTASLARRLAGPAFGWLAPALLLPSYTVLHEAPVVGNNLPVAFAILVAAEIAATRGRGLGLALGAALTFKYTALGGVGAVLLAAPLSWRGRAQAGLIAVACLVPWWARNAAEGLHPLFPYAGWGSTGGVELHFQHLEKYGAGRAPADLLALPYRAIFTAQIDSFRFLGRLHPGVAPAALLALVPLRRASVGQPQWLRHLLPILPLICVGAAQGAAELLAVAQLRPTAQRALTAALAGLFLLDSPRNLGPVFEAAADTSRLHQGVEPAEAYLARRVPGADAAAWLNARAPGPAVVALLRSWDVALLERRSLLGTVEDHVPLRHLILQPGGDPLAALRAAGATHALVGPRAFTAKAYPFLSAAEYAAAYAKPEAALEDALLMGATLLYSAEGYAVYALDAPSPAAAALP